MSGEFRNLTTADVSEGEALPPLRYDVSTTTVVLGAMASRDWRPMHHDRGFAVDRNGMKDIFMNTPNQAAWLERYLSDWAGPTCRLGRFSFRMHDSVFPGDTMTIQGVVEKVETDVLGCSWARLALTLKVKDKTMTSFSARVALPSKPRDNPWVRRGEDWRP